MNRREKRAIATFEIFLLVSLSFAVSFAMSEYVGVAGAQSDISRLYPRDTSLDTSFASPSVPVAPTSGASGANLITGGGAAVQQASGLIAGAAAPTGLAENAWIISDGVAYYNKAGILTHVSAGTYPVNGQNIVVGAAGKIGSTVAPTLGAKTPATGITGLLSGNAFGGGATFAGAISSLTSGLLWGAAVYGALYLVGNLLGLSDSQTQSLALSGGLGTFAGSSAYLLASNGILGNTLGAHAGLFGLGIGIGVGAAIFLATYKKEKKEIIQFQCLPWEAPRGGARCDECNDDALQPCSEYRCKSLGQGCELVNKGEGQGKELCVWKNKGDTTAPKLTPWNEALEPNGLSYVRDGANGYKISRAGATNGCLQAFTKLEFGIKTDEPAQCRVSLERTQKYDDMTFLFGETNIFGLEHAQKNFRVPDPFDEQGGAVPEIHNDGTYTLYVRCLDANGNGKDSAETAFRFCVERGPDTSAPIIEGFSIPTGSPVRFEVDKVPIEVYTNKPSECRWSKQDKSFEVMENKMNCANDARDFNSDLNYICDGDLTGVVDKQDNFFFFRCKSWPGRPENQRFTMGKSETLLLRGTEPLTIDKTGPSGEIRGSTTFVDVNLTVETLFGAEQGKATCYYSLEENNLASFNIAMLGFTTASHNQPIGLQAGNYNYFFRCIDKGGNVATGNTQFSIVVDTQQPLVTRAFRDGNKLKIITNEEARCVYSLTSCVYDFTESAGNALTWEEPQSGRRFTHSAPWDPDKTYYIKCEDFQGKRPQGDQCSIVVQGTVL